MKKILIIAAILKFQIVNAQDTIIKKDGSVHIGTVTEISSTNVKYLLNGTDVTISAGKSELKQINFRNGTKEYFNNSTPVAPIAPEKYRQEDTYYKKPDSNGKQDVKKRTEYGKNIIAINVFEMLFTNIGFSYERILGDGSIGLKIPFSFGLGGKPNDNNYVSNYWSTIPLQNKIYGTGLELNVYPIKQNRNVFYLGLSATYTEFKYFRDTLNSNIPYSPYYKKQYLGKQYSGMIHVGGYIGLTDNLLMGGKAAIGFRREETVIEDYTLPRVQIDFNLAYRF